MTTETRRERLAAELDAMQSLRKVSDILAFECTGTPPDRYVVTFHGRGICRRSSAAVDLGLVDLHRVEIRLPFFYPDRAPDVRWLTPIFHPNVSHSGLISLSEIGLTWSRDLGLDVICERLWDVARLAFIDYARASHASAKHWFEEHPGFALPVDPRPLRDRPPTPSIGLVRHGAHERANELTSKDAGAAILFIGENTPTPEIPLRRKAAPIEGVLYIGDD